MRCSRTSLLVLSLALSTTSCLSTTPSTTGALAPSTSGTTAGTSNAGTNSTPSAGSRRPTAVKGQVEERRYDEAIVIKPLRKKEPIIIASQELDSQCETIVAPYELSAGVIDLLMLAARTAGDEIGKAVAPEKGKQDLSNSRARATAKDTAKHNLSRTTREAAIRMNWLPMEVEVAYGEMQHDKMQDGLLDRNGRGKQLYSRAEALLADALAGVDKPHDYAFRIFIRTESGENAMSLPGGIIYIDKELIANKGKEAKARFALAHEVAHILQRHETRNAQARIIDAVSLRGGYKDLVQTIRSLNDRNTAALAVILAGKTQFERHFGAQELQADACAVRILNNSMDTRQALLQAVDAFVRSLPPPPPEQDSKKASVINANRQIDVGNMVELVVRPIDRHPNSDERSKRLRRMLGSCSGRR